MEEPVARSELVDYFAFLASRLHYYLALYPRLSAYTSSVFFLCRGGWRADI